MVVGRVLWQFALASLFFVTNSHGRTIRTSHDNDLSARDSGSNICGNDLPSDWICSSGSDCLLLNNTGTRAAICCPKSDSSKCSTVAPISCDISKQNATAYPHSSLFTENLDQQLPSCGKENCCPLGYSCRSNTCVMDEDTRGTANALSTASSVASQTTSATSVSNTPSSPSSAATSTSISGSSSLSQQTPVPPTASNFPPQAVLAGFIPGIILGALICACIFFLLRRRSMKRMASDNEGGSGEFGHTLGGGIVRSTHLRPHLTRLPRHKHKISDPIYDHSMSNRSVFIKHSRGSPEMSKNVPPRTPSRSKRWHRSPRPGPGTWDSGVPTLTHPTPDRRYKPRLNIVTPTPPPRDDSGHQQLTPNLPGLAVTTKSGSRVSNLLKPLSPSMQKTRNFGTLSPGPKSPPLPPFQVPPKTGEYASRSNSNKSAATMASHSTSRPGHSRHSTDASSGTIDFLLAPYTGPMNGSFPLSNSPPQLPDKGKTVEHRTPQRTPQRAVPRLGEPWQTPTIPESPGQRSLASNVARPVTTFTTLMLDAGFSDGSPRKAVRKA